MARLNNILIEAKASKFRSANGFSPSEPINLKSVLLKLNVLTLFRPLSSDFSGMCMKDMDGHGFMLINSNNPIGRQHFTIAHELFHLFEEEKIIPHVCNPGGGGKNASEQNADAFAAELLMPKEGLWNLIPENELKNKNISLPTILKIEHYYSVSRLALLFRLLNIDAISKNRKEEIDNMSPAGTAWNYGYDTSLYKAGNEGLVIGDYGEKARLLFEKSKISEGHYLELLSKINRNAEEKEN